MKGPRIWLRAEIERSSLPSIVEEVQRDACGVM